MERADLPEVDFTDMDRGYESQGDLARDLFKWLDLILYRYYERHSVLYPVAVCNRLWDSAFRRRGSSKKALRQIMSGSESSRLQLEVMKELGITE